MNKIAPLASLAFLLAASPAAASTLCYYLTSSLGDSADAATAAHLALPNLQSEAGRNAFLTTIAANFSSLATSQPHQDPADPWVIEFVLREGNCADGLAPVRAYFDRLKAGAPSAGVAEQLSIYQSRVRVATPEEAAALVPAPPPAPPPRP